jgi:protein TonB
MGYQALLFCPDEKTTRTVTQVLSDLDFTVEPCTEPFGAVKKLMAQHFDAVVVDCDNEQNATLLFKSARNSSSNQSSLAVAVVEGQAGVAKAFRIGANLVLTKPINVEQAKGTLRVARGLLRKGGDAPKAGTPAVPTSTPAGVTSKPATPAARPGASSSSTTPLSAPSAAAKKPNPSVIPFQRSAAPTIPSIAASTHVAEMDDQDSDGILEADDFETVTDQPEVEAQPATPPPAPATGTVKFPWQPSAKMAEPMASALRRAAEAAGQVEPSETAPAKQPTASPVPEKRPMSGAMFQAQGHAAARAVEKTPSAVAAAPTIAETPVASKSTTREIAEPRAESSAVMDTTRDDVAPPTFFPGGYDPEEVEGGGRIKALVIVAAVVLLAASAGYLSWKNAGGKNAAPTAAAQGTSTPSGQSTETASTHETATSSEQGATDITLAGTGSSASAPTPHTTPSKPSPNEIASEPRSAPEAEVTQRLIVKNDTRRPTPPANPQEQEAVQAPSAIGLESSADTKALASISNAPINVPKASPQLLRVSQGVMEGLVLKRVQPRYPIQALQMRIQGPVQLQATISKTGDIGNLKVVSGDAVLARAAQEAVKQWKYKPYYLNGEPVQIETQILVNFRLPN